MALGFSGSNGGIGEINKQFVLTDIEAGILKYEALSNHIKNKEVGNFYKKVIEGLRQLKQIMANC
jgi:hypothetical protein